MSKLNKTAGQAALSNERTTCQQVLLCCHTQSIGASEGICFHSHFKKNKITLSCFSEAAHNLLSMGHNIYKRLLCWCLYSIWQGLVLSIMRGKYFFIRSPHSAISTSTSTELYFSRTGHETPWSQFKLFAKCYVLKCKINPIRKDWGSSCYPCWMRPCVYYRNKKRKLPCRCVNVVFYSLFISWQTDHNVTMTWKTFRYLLTTSFQLLSVIHYLQKA